MRTSMTWTAELGALGEMTGDRRVIDEGCVLAFQTSVPLTLPPGEVIGCVDEFALENGLIKAKGHVHEEGFGWLIASGRLAPLLEVEAEHDGTHVDEQLVMHLTRGTVIGIAAGPRSRRAFGSARFTSIEAGEPGW
jgi:hypothetical protein